MYKYFAEKLSQAINSNIPFALVRKPNEKLIELWVNDDSESNIFLLRSFDNQIEKSISDKNPLQINQEEFDFEFELNLQSSMDFYPVSEENYIKLIQNTIDKIKNSEIDKIVISRIKQIENKKFNLFKSFKNLTENHSNALVYLWHNPGNETWMGATPELLLSRIGKDLKTVSLAGTKLPENEWTDKEYVEQQIVTDYIVANFSGVDNVKVEGPETVQVGKFQHLKSYISAEIDDDSPINHLLEKLHPTPAVCGLPKQDAFDYILKNEGYNREFYSGYIGIETENLQEYFVNLRCTQFFGNSIWIYVGGGITADSIPEKEWNETELKSGTIQNSLA